MAAVDRAVEDYGDYEDCDRCGERYVGEFAGQYLRDEEHVGGARRVCCAKPKAERGAPPP